MPDSHPAAALVIAHPGHELRVFRWLELARPVVYVLTDGSGHAGRSRLAATTALLARAGARPGSIYGRLTDRELYQALLAGDGELFAGLAGELAEALRGEGVAWVAGDAVEGFNPGHDVCRLLVNAAVANLRAGGRPIDNRDFPLDGAPADGQGGPSAACLRIELDGAALARKLVAARSYPGLEDEVARAVARHGGEAFRSECLRPVRYGLEIEHLFPHPPFYESYGERQVAAGIYREVLRWRDHVLPVAERLRRLAGAAPGRTAACAGGSC
jgi:hypothetical protein